MKIIEEIAKELRKRNREKKKEEDTRSQVNKIVIYYLNKILDGLKSTGETYFYFDLMEDPYVKPIVEEINNSLIIDLILGKLEMDLGFLIDFAGIAKDNNNAITILLDSFFV